MSDSQDETHEQTPVVLTYDPKPSLRHASAVALQAGMAGTLVSAIQNALGSHNRGASGFLTRTGGTIGFFAAMGFTFALTESVVANQRAKDDALNGVAGGCAAGFLAGIRARSLPAAVAGCAVLGAVIGTFDYGGKSIMGSTSGLSAEEKRQRFFKHPQSSPLQTPVSQSSDSD